MHCRLAITILAVTLAATTAAQPADLRLVLPRDLYAVAGHEMSLYFDNVILTPASGALIFDVDCPIGRQDQDRFRVTPLPADIGDHPFSLRITDGSGAVLTQGAATLHVAPADSGAGRELTLLCVGDSLTHASVYPQELLALTRAGRGAQFKLIGTHHPWESLPADVVHEGYGGWAWETFLSHWTASEAPGSRSPFLRLENVKPVLDFQAYCDRANQGLAPDCITVFLGCNDTFGANDANIEDTIDRMLIAADRLLSEFRRVGPETRIGLLLLTPPAASQDAFGSNYTCGQTRWQYRRNQHRVVERMTEHFAGREAENLFLIPAHTNLDTRHNYPTAQEPASSRNQTPVERQSNAVHPAAAGYLQIADSIHAWLQFQLAR